MTAKDNNNIFKKMKLLKKILDIKCCKQEKCRENCIYEKKNWFTGNKERNYITIIWLLDSQQWKV